MDNPWTNLTKLVVVAVVWVVDLGVWSQNCPSEIKLEWDLLLFVCFLGLKEVVVTFDLSVTRKLTIFFGGKVGLIVCFTVVRRGFSVEVINFKPVVTFDLSVSRNLCKIGFKVDVTFGFTFESVFFVVRTCLRLEVGFEVDVTFGFTVGSVFFCCKNEFGTWSNFQFVFQMNRVTLIHLLYRNVLNHTSFIWVCLLWFDNWVFCITLFNALQWSWSW